VEDEICDWEKVASPDVFGMVVQEGGPVLSSWSCGANLPHVLLNGPLAHVNAQPKSFATDPLCSPQSFIPCHLLDQRYGLSGDLRCGRSCSRLVFPQELEALSIPLQERLWLDTNEGLFPAPNYPG